MIYFILLFFALSLFFTASFFVMLLTHTVGALKEYREQDAIDYISKDSNRIPRLIVMWIAIVCWIIFLYLFLSHYYI